MKPGGTCAGVSVIRPGRVTRVVSLLVLVAFWLSGCVSASHENELLVESGAPVVLAASIRGAWYAGDLHCHSTWSDGDSPLETVVATAEARGLDFLAVTDHDTSMRGVPLHWSDPAYCSDQVVLLYGVEWTTSSGHANILAAEPFDYTALWSAGRAAAVSDAVAAARAQGAIFSINHPVNPFCPWEYGFVDDDGAFLADALEIWNGPFLQPSRNQNAIRTVWDDLLLQGLRVTGVGGSDNHQIEGAQRNFNPHGAPTTWVYATERSAEAIIGGIRAGRVSLSSQPSGDRLELLADADGDGAYESMIGNRIPSGRQTRFAVAAIPPQFTASTPVATPGAGRRYTCEIWKNGELFARVPLRPGAGNAAVFTDIPGAGDYYRAVLKGAPHVGPLRRIVMGRTLAVTNPIYVGR